MQHVARTRFEIARRYQPVKHRQQGALLQRRLAPAAHELQCLGDELDLADATGTEFDVGPIPLRATSRSMSVFIARNDSNVP